MESEPSANIKPEVFRIFMNNFKVNWLVKCIVPFKELEALPKNFPNSELPIFGNFNGQNVPNKTGNFLMHVFYALQ